MSGTTAPKMAGCGGDGKWSCTVCTYSNYPLSRRCTMCRAPAPTARTIEPEPPAAADDEDNATATEPRGSPDSPSAEAVALADSGAEAAAEAIAERLAPLRIAEPRAQPKWACQTCTYENWPRAVRCAMCGAAGRAASPTDGAICCDSSGTNDTAAEQGGLGPHSPKAERTPSPNTDKHSNGGAEWQRSESEERRKRRPSVDWLWLQACIGVVENRMQPVQCYLSVGGDATRALTAAECARLGRPSAFDTGHTLVHLAIRFQRSEILSVVLSRISGGGPGLKRSPSFAAPDLAQQLRRHAAAAIRPPGPDCPTPYLADFPTFTLPAEIESLPAAVQQQLLNELLDRDCQSQLEEDPMTINWAPPPAGRLHALWNRSLGDCLPDALSQCLYGVFDRMGWIRGALSECLTLTRSARPIYERWAAWERAQAAANSYCPTDSQLRAEWCRLVSSGGSPGSPLSPLHVFAAAQLLRRPLLLYGVSLVRSFRGEPLGYAKFQGLYLPLLWEPAQCSKAPLVLGYTRGHFSALVAIEPPPRRYILNAGPERAIYLPLVDSAGEPLPVPFAAPDEPVEATLATQWLNIKDVGGVPCARLVLPQRPLLVAQMMEEWLNHYRRIAQQTRGPFPPRLVTDYCSDNGTDEE